MQQWIFLFAFLLAVVPAVAFALNLNLDYPNFGGFDLNDDQELNEIVAFFYYFIIGISGLAAFVMLVWGGVQWLLSGAIPAQASEARDKVRNAILGLLLILASFLVIQIINPALTVLPPGLIQDPCNDPANAAKCAGGIGVQDPGVFLFDDENLQGKYIYIDPTACPEVNDFTSINLGTCDPQNKSTAGTIDWNDDTASVKFDAKAWDVVLFEHVGPGGKAICLRSTAVRLKGFPIRILLSGGSWEDRASAMRVQATGSLESCATHGITLPNINEAPPHTDQPVVFFFNAPAFDTANGRWIIGYPFETWGPTPPLPSSPGPRQSEYEPNVPVDVYSIWVEGGERCSEAPGVPFEECAVFVSDTSSAQINRSIDPLNPGDTYICFTSSLPDTTEKDTKGDFKYSFNCNGGTPITKQINKVEVKMESLCKNPGIVQNCR